MDIKEYRKRLLATIHSHKKHKELKSVDCWGDWLHVRFGVESSAVLSIKELKMVLDIMNGVSEDGENLSDDKSGREMIVRIKQGGKSGSGNASLKQKKSIVALWQEKARDKSREAMFRFIHTVTKKLFVSLEAIDTKEASRVIMAMNKI